MAGHSQFKNIMHRKGAQDAKKAKQFTKLIREVTVAVKAGGPDSDSNPRLRRALIAAKEANLPKSRLENAISKASSSSGGENFEEVVYECYLSGGIALIVDALTDNRNRAASDIRALLTRNGGSLATEGAVLYLFDRLGLVEFQDKNISAEALLEATIEAGGLDCISGDAHISQVFCDRDSLHEVQQQLSRKFGEAKSAKLIWQPKNYVQLEEQEQAQKIIDLIDALEDLDDVQNIYGNYMIAPEILNKIE
jgi:YebC/PmpR family DNA-binding regulatory protein